MIELLVALAINTFLIAALVSIFSSNVTNYNQSIKSDQLNDQLTAVMNIMANDIQRAGYWSNAYLAVSSGQNNNPFMTASTDIQTGNSGSCILFTYDANHNGTLPSISASYDDERYGYRLNGGAVQSRPRGATFSCSASASNWRNLTDPNVITITGLTFTINATNLPLNTNGGGSSTTALLTRSVDISLSGKLVSNPSNTQTITEHLRVRNHKFLP